MMMSKLGKKLIVAAREGVAIARGEADPSTYRLHIPSKIDVKAMRKKLGMTQETFALRYGKSGPCFQALADRLKTIYFPSWPGFVPAIHVFFASAPSRRGCPAQGRA
jgi:hypothetical protein